MTLMRWFWNVDEEIGNWFYGIIEATESKTYDQPCDKSVISICNSLILINIINYFSDYIDFNGFCSSIH